MWDRRGGERLSLLVIAALSISLAGCGGSGNGGSGTGTSGMSSTGGTAPSSSPPPSTSPPASSPPAPSPPAPSPPVSGPPPVNSALGAGNWHTSGNKILDANNATVRMAGVNWYGFETTDHLVHGLWAQDYQSVLNTIKSLGFNVIRIPFSNELVEVNPVPTNFTTNAGGKAANAALVGKSALEDLDTLVAYAGSIGLRVILDNHRSEAGNSNEAKRPLVHQRLSTGELDCRLADHGHALQRSQVHFQR